MVQISPEEVIRRRKLEQSTVDELDGLDRAIVGDYIGCCLVRAHSSALPFFAVLFHNTLARLQLEHYLVGFAGESDKKLSSLSRKFGSRSTITSAGAGGSCAGFTSTGRTCNGDAQPPIASAQIRYNPLSFALFIPQLLLVSGRNDGHVLGMLALGRARLLVQIDDALVRSGQRFVVALEPGRALGLGSDMVAVKVRATHRGNEADNGSQHHPRIQRPKHKSLSFARRVTRPGSFRPPAYTHLSISMHAPV